RWRCSWPGGAGATRWSTGATCRTRARARSSSNAGWPTSSVCRWETSCTSARSRRALSESRWGRTTSPSRSRAPPASTYRAGRWYGGSGRRRSTWRSCGCATRASSTRSSPRPARSPTGLGTCASSRGPAWRAASRPPTEVMRGGDLGRPRRQRKRVQVGGGYFALGARLTSARRGRLAATVAALGAAVAVVLLMLSLAALLDRLKEDPALLGRRYQLTVSASTADRQLIAQVPGVAAVGERYFVDGADAFALGQPVRLIAYPGDHTRFESPPLASGRRVAAPNEAEVGLGLAQALGLEGGTTLVVDLQGGEARFRVG